jgi:hypothetical protein
MAASVSEQAMRTEYHEKRQRRKTSFMAKPPVRGVTPWVSGAQKCRSNCGTGAMSGEIGGSAPEVVVAG